MEISAWYNLIRVNFSSDKNDENSVWNVSAHKWCYNHNFYVYETIGWQRNKEHVVIQYEAIYSWIAWNWIVNVIKCIDVPSYLVTMKYAFPENFSLSKILRSRYFNVISNKIRIISSQAFKSFMKDLRRHFSFFL